MTIRTANTPAWTGRVDANTGETGPSQRWHQHMQPLSDASRGGVTLIGFAVDEGVQRNAGQPGAALGPQAARAALANLPILGEPELFDAGDVACLDGALERAQTELAARVAQAIARRSLPLVIGGGHEVAWGSFQGIVQSPTSPQRLLIVNLDAHFDLRMATQANSGTPFRQMHEWCVSQGRPFLYRVLGISRFANTQTLFDRAQAMGVHHWLDESLQDRRDLQPVSASLSADLGDCDAVYLTICLDALPGSLAPGVSAPAPLGVPMAIVEAVVDLVGRSGKLIAADIAELNPTLDRGGLTARVAARLAARIARHAPSTGRTAD